MVSLEELERLKREVKELENKRLKQFIALQLEGRCRLIAVKLGKPREDKVGIVREFKDGDLYIRYYHYHNVINVKYRDNIVLSVTNGSLELYRPGKWLGKVIQLSKHLIEEELDREYLYYLGRKKNWELVEG